MKKSYKTVTNNKNLIRLFADKLNAIQGGTQFPEFAFNDLFNQVSDESILQPGEELQQIAFSFPVILN